MFWAFYPIGMGLGVASAALGVWITFSQSIIFIAWSLFAVRQLWKEYQREKTLT